MPSLSLLSGIGLEYSSPWRERAASSPDVGEKNFQKYENGTGKNEMKSLSLSDEELKAKINTKAEVVSHLVRNVTQDGVDKIDTKREKGNATPTDDCDLLTRREFILCYPDFTQYNNWEDNGTVSDITEPLNSPLDKEVQLQENEIRQERQADEGTGKGNLALRYDGHEMPTLCHTTETIRILPNFVVCSVAIIMLDSSLG